MTGKTKISTTTRLAAAVVLVCWSVAFSVCWHHCATGICNGSAKAAVNTQPSCHAHTDSGQEDSKSKSEQSSCFAKKPFFGKTELVLVESSALHLAYLNASLIVVYELPISFDLSFTRQTTSPEWLFTPEVSLGPAFRSHAPPILS